MVHIFNTKGPKSAPKRVSLPGSIEDPETSDQIDDLRHSDCNPDPSYTQRACENGQIMERILNYCDCFPSYDKQFEQYMEKKNLTARACNFFEHVRQGFCDYHLKYRMIPLCLQGRLQNRLKLCCTDTKRPDNDVGFVCTRVSVTMCTRVSTPRKHPRKY